MSARNASAMSYAASCATFGSSAVASMVRIGLAATVRASKVTSSGIFVVALNRVIVAGSLKMVIYPTTISASCCGADPASTSVDLPAYVGCASTEDAAATSTPSAATTTTTHHRCRICSMRRFQMRFNCPPNETIRTSNRREKAESGKRDATSRSSSPRPRLPANSTSSKPGSRDPDSRLCAHLTCTAPIGGQFATRFRLSAERSSLVWRRTCSKAAR